MPESITGARPDDRRRAGQRAVESPPGRPV